MNEYKVIGLMSGTSLDGVDVAFCVFKEISGKWDFEIVKAETFPYENYWIKKLKNLHSKDALTFVKIHSEYGYFLGKLTSLFLSKHKLKPDFISSHGHTIFHQPDKSITFQIGDGAAIATNTRLPVVCDFRSLDVKLGGQGAPLVPVGDKKLFSEYDFCLNLGGFANVSFDKKGKRIAFDICPVNIILNELASELNKKFDDKGEIAASGIINKNLLTELNNLEFYKKSPPKSLSKEWLEKFFIPVINYYQIPIKDKLRTITEHIAMQVSASTLNSSLKKIFVTGGGVFNDFLIKRIKAQTNHQIIIPDERIIKFKEALIFAFLGVLRLRIEVNCLKSVTGARKDNIGGVVYNI